MVWVRNMRGCQAPDPRLHMRAELALPIRRMRGSSSSMPCSILLIVIFYVWFSSFPLLLYILSTYLVPLLFASRSLHPNHELLFIVNVGSLVLGASWAICPPMNSKTRLLATIMRISCTAPCQPAICITVCLCICDSSVRVLL